MNVLIKELLKYKSQSELELPKIGILIVSYNASSLLPKTLSRIPDEVYEIIEEVFVFDDASPDDTFERGNEYISNSEWKEKISIYKNPKNLGYGGNQKTGFDYAISKGLDYVVLLHGDGQYAPEFLPNMIHEAVVNENEIVFGSRMIDKKEALKGGMPLYKWVGNQVLTQTQNFILNMKLSEFHSGYRMYGTGFLKSVNFMLNSDGFDFDTQIIIQARASRTTISEIPIPTFYGEELCHVDGLDYAFKIMMWTIKYRLHQLHLIHLELFDAKYNSNYVRKNSLYSSHGCILSQIGECSGLNILDVGAADGILSSELVERGASVTAIDLKFDQAKQRDDIKYLEHDLNDSSRLSFEREFDYIIAADVVEHLTNGDDFIRNLQYLLKPDGKLIISTPNIAIWFYRISLLLGRFNYGPRGILDYTHVRLYTKSTFVNLLHQGGFRVLNLMPTNLPFELIFKSSGKSMFIKLLDKVYSLFNFIWKAMFAYQFVAVCEITHLDAAGAKEGLVKNDN